MDRSIFTIVSNEPLAPGVFRLVLRGALCPLPLPGQFVNIRLEGEYLRRPLSVCDAEDGKLVLVYKVVGRGTGKLSSLKEGELDLLTGLGNGFDLSAAGEKPLLVGGGVGVPPLYLLAKRLRARGIEVCVILGFNTASEIILEKEFASLGCGTLVTTADGSRGIKGFVTAAMDALPYSFVYACGPEPMLRAVWEKTKTGGQFSFEERMGCGFGACMGCSCRTLTGWKRICREGPVLSKEEILWK